MKKQFTMIAVVALMTGCASNDGLQQQVSTLSNKVDKLTTEISKLKANQEKQDKAIKQLQMAHEENAQKMENITKSYKK